MSKTILMVENPVKSEIMSRASKLRTQGYSPSEALSQAWSEYQYGDWEEKPKRRRSNPTTTEEGVNLGGILLVAGLGYLIWCLWAKNKTGGQWTWTPWKLGGLFRRQIASKFPVPSPVPTNSANPLTQETVSLILP